MVSEQSFKDKVVDKIKNTYYYFEDKWYGTLDKIDPKIPVYKIIDPVDEVIPSFILFLISILFILILIGYLIQFATPATIVFHTYDSDSKDALNKVELSGIINGVDFEVLTDSKGRGEAQIQSTRKNFYDMLGEMIFGSEDKFSGIVNAQKDDYKSIRRHEIENATMHKLYLEPEAEELKFAPQVKVSLYDNTTEELIVDSSDLGLVKFECDNKSSLPKSVRDGTDGEIDGVFILNENNCDFIITYAKSTGYEKKEPSLRADTSQTNNIYLNPIETNTKGTAKITVKDTNDTELEGISINFVGVSGSIVTDASGVARKELDPGTYIITITDENYYSINPDQNVTIDITKGGFTEKTINLRKKSFSDSRKILIKVIEGTDNNVVKNAQINVFWVREDGNNFTNIAPNGAVIPQVQGLTDGNGLFESRVFSKEDVGDLIIVIDKEGYILTEFLPNLIKLNENTPQVIKIEKATNENSANALIITEGGDQNKPLMGASTYIIHSITIDNKKFNVAYPAKDSNINGMATFDRIPVGNYFAGAKYKSQSKISLLSSIDYSQTRVFKLHFDLNLSDLEIVLINMETGQIIPTQNQGKVTTYYYSDPTEKTKLEELEFIGNKFVNNVAYDPENNYIITADLNGFIQNSRIFDSASNPIAEGKNEIRIIMPVDITGGRGECNGEWIYTPSEEWVCEENPPNCPENKYNLVNNEVVCSTTCDAPDEWIAWNNGFICYPNDFPYSANGSVGIFYDNLYSSLASAENEIPDVDIINTGKEYAIKFRTIIYDSDLTYKELFSMNRMNGATIESLSEYSNLPDSQVNKGLFSCNTINLEGANNRDENYYFPNCLDTPKEQSAVKWFNNNLEIKTYNFINKFKVTKSTGENVNINYRASEVDSNGFSETPLQIKSIPIGEPLTTGFFANIKFAEINQNFNFEDENPIPANLEYNQTKDVEITIYNNSNNNVENGKVSIYSYNGELNNFNEEGSGTIHFSNDQTKETLTSSLSIPRFNNSKVTTTATATMLYRSNFIIVLIEINNEKLYAIFDVSTLGSETNLDAEFLSGVFNPIIFGTVYPKTGIGNIEIKDVTIKIDKNCDAKTSSGLDETKIELVGQVNSANISQNTFNHLTSGVFKDHVDCVWISVTPKPSTSHFENIVDERVWASPNNAFDPTLSCMQIRDETGETEIDLDWEETKIIQVQNLCSREVKFKVESGVICSTDGGTCDNSSGYELVSGDIKEFTLTGKNNSYNNAYYPNFSDILGYFPVYLKAKYSDEPRKKYALADKLAVHLRNDKECFSISKDEFDLIESTEENFIITNHCQDTTIEDYYLPDVKINSFGFDLNSDKPVNTSLIDFDVSLTITGTQYGTIEEVETISDTAWGDNVILFKDLDESNVSKIDNNLNYYSNINFDFNFDLIEGTSRGQYDVKNIQISVIDINNYYIDKDTPFGARIDSNIIATYEDNSTKIIPLRNNLVLTPEFDCEGSHCILGHNFGEGAEFDDLVFGTFYLDLSEEEQGKIKSIEMNFFGNEDTNLLEVKATPIIDYNTFTTNINREDSSEDEEIIPLGTFSIPKIPSINNHLKRISELPEFSTQTFLDKDNPKVFIESDNPEVIVWIFGNSLKAKYVGSNYAPDSDGSIQRTLVKIFGKGTNHSLINIVDYVNTIIAASENMEISGAR